jgi:sensor histidine kinase YesM
MLSQIQPHFLYNVIGTIRGMCRVDGEQAWKALGDFATYLRGNMDVLSNRNRIHFSAELKHIEAYLRLEKMRMGERLHVQYDISEKDFYLPPLTIQPLVENAVKHGLFEKESGGTVRVSSNKVDNGICIEVEDDGVGFDSRVLIETDEHHAHIGLSNVKKRIEKMSKGTLIVESKPGTGTKITVILRDIERGSDYEYTGNR